MFYKQGLKSENCGSDLACNLKVTLFCNSLSFHKVNRYCPYISDTASSTPQILASSSIPSSLMTVLSTSKHTASAEQKSFLSSEWETILRRIFLLPHKKKIYIYINIFKGTKYNHKRSSFA